MSLSVDAMPPPPRSDGGLVFKPLTGGGSEVTFGADAGALDLEHLTDEQFAALERAVITHLVVVVRGQKTLSPRAQFELTKRFDPKVQSYGHGNKLELMKKSVLMQDLVSIPACPQVKLLGNGRVRDHEGIPDVELRHPSHKTFHQTPLTDEQMAAGFTRFYRWHMDAALYDLNPPRVTTLLALEVPEARRETVLYDDGSGDKLEVQLGTTAFVSGAKAFELLLAGPEGVGAQDQGALRPAPVHLDEERPRPLDRAGADVGGARAAAGRAAAVRRGEGDDAAARLEEPADREAVAAAPRLLRRGSDRRRNSRSATSPRCGGCYSS